MRYFKLPDLGEGLPEAEIVKWHVSVGDKVEQDQLLVEVETAKAIVEVPSPQAGTIAALFGEEGDIIHTGEPLLEYANEQDEDTGTVVGKLETAQSTATTHSRTFIVGAAESSKQAKSHPHPGVTPAVAALAKRLDVNLQQIKPDPNTGRITSEQVERAAQLQAQHGKSEQLRGVRRTMALSMQKSHAEVVPVTLVEDADIDHWPKGEDITMRLVQAIAHACQSSPALNGWFDGEQLSRRLMSHVDLGIAVDTEEGLFVPVLRDVSNRDIDDLRQGLDRLRADVIKRKIPPKEMQGATITLSNFGTIAGKYASPVVVPPQIAIIGAGVIRDEVVAVKQGNEKGMAVHRILPISLTFDHRAVTGGEAARFMRGLLESLSG